MSMACWWCTYKDGECIYPRYGLAPEIENHGPFEPDEDNPGFGTFTECPKCGNSREE